MVAVRAAAAELEELVLAVRQINDPRWRLEAIAGLVPALRCHGMALDFAWSDVGEAARRATCPVPLREPIAYALSVALLRSGARAIAELASALQCASWSEAALRAAPACTRATIAGIHAAVPWWLQRRISDALRRGYVPQHGNKRSWPRFVGSVHVRGMERTYEPSVPLVIALVDAICASGEAQRIGDVETIASWLAPHDRAIATAHLARLELALGGDAEARVRGIRADGPRAGAWLVLVRAALADGCSDDAERFARAIEPHLVGQQAQLDLARDELRRGELTAATQRLTAIDDPRLSAERLVAECEARLAAGQLARPPAVTRAMLRVAWQPPAWTELAPYAVTTLERWLVVSTARDRQAPGARLSKGARRALLELVDLERGDQALRAEWIAVRAEQLTAECSQDPRRTAHPPSRSTTP